MAWDNNQPPDLDEILKKFVKNIKQAFGGHADSSKPSSGQDEPPIKWIASAVFGVVFVLWFLSGIFIVDPAEQAAILRFGQYVETVGPGPHWIPSIIDKRLVVNVDRVLDYAYSAQMLTKDENLVSVSLVVQYRIGDLNDYLFNVNNPEESLQQATSSALRQVVGMNTLNEIITEGREAWGISVEEQLNKILKRYHTGIVIVNVSPQPARAPEPVQDAFDDAIKAQEDEKRYKEQAAAYQASVVPIAEGKAKRILQEAEAFQQQVVLNAKGDVALFEALLPQYQSNPSVVRSRMYLETMQGILARVNKVIVDSKQNNIMYLPLEKWMNSNVAAASNGPQSNLIDAQ